MASILGIITVVKSTRDSTGNHLVLAASVFDTRFYYTPMDFDIMVISHLEHAEGATKLLSSKKAKTWAHGLLFTFAIKSCYNWCLIQQGKLPRISSGYRKVLSVEAGK